MYPNTHAFDESRFMFTRHDFRKQYRPTEKIVRHG